MTTKPNKKALSPLKHSDRILQTPPGKYLRVTRQIKIGYPTDVTLSPGDRVRSRGTAADSSDWLICWSEDAEPVWLNRSDMIAFEAEE